uniref:Serine protease 54 n=1 Tax=Rousettus aegyptiacus TaxID=9407 RepID=A0A7J8CKM4_ROUAE|nr:serine protease 54 [Rousettus aegyptiacus]
MESHDCNRTSHDDEYPEENLREKHRYVSLTQLRENRMWLSCREGNRCRLLGGSRKPNDVPATAPESLGAERNPVQRG